MTVLLRNNVDSTLATAASSSDLGMTVANGGLFPQPASGEYFYATVTDPAGLFEIVKVTARAGNNLTVVRAQEGTAPVAFAAGSRIELRVTAQTIADAISDSELDIAAYFAAAGNGTSVGLNVGPGKTLNVDGTLDATDGVALLPQANNPAQTTEGSVVWDNSDDVLTVGTGSGRKTMVDTDSVQTVRNKTIDGSSLLGSTVNNTPVGQTTAAPGSFTTLNASGAINFLPVGSVIMWYGAVGNIPAGWALCDGLTEGVPNLLGRFVVGAGGAYALGDTGGSADAVVVSHTHAATIQSGGEHSHRYYPYGQGATGATGATGFAAQTLPTISGTYEIYTMPGGVHNHSATVTAPVGSVPGTNRNLPPYYALYFIMRVV